MKSVRLLNRKGDPYKLKLAIWQGEPTNGGGAWVGGIERMDGRRADANLDTMESRDAPAFFGPTVQELEQRALLDSS